MKKIKTNFGAQTVIISLSLLAALPTRVYQYLHVIDGTTGFFNNWWNPTVFGLYGLCLCVIILVLALSAKGGKKAIYAMPSGKRMSLGFASVVLAVSFLAEGGYNAWRAYRIAKGFLPVEQLVLGNSVGKPTLMFTLLQAVFAVLSAVYFFAFAAGYFQGKDSLQNLKVFAMFPALWSVARMMIDFTQTVSYRYVSELLFELCMVVFFALFWVSFAKFSVGALQKRVQMRIFGYGFLSVFFGLLCAVPRYIILLMGRQDVLYKSIAAFEVTDLIIPIFAACFIFAVAAGKQYKSVEEYQAN